MGVFEKIKCHIWKVENGATRRAATVLFCGVIEPLARALWWLAVTPLFAVLIPILAALRGFVEGVQATWSGVAGEAACEPDLWREWWRVLRVLWRSSESVWLESEEARRFASHPSRRVPG